MARCIAKEETQYCETCEKWITEREMIPHPEVPEGGWCPGCRETLWAKIVVRGRTEDVKIPGSWFEIEISTFIET